MTEQEWVACTDPTPMLEFLRGKASDRKLLLFAVTCCYLGGRKTLVPNFEAVVRFADGHCNLNEVRNYWAPGFSSAYVSWPEQPFAWASSFVREYTIPDEGGVDRRPKGDKLPPFLHDIFGNPFRPIAIDPRWLTSTVVDLAAVIYQEKAFDRMPNLVDALMDAGCDNDEIIDHCRSGGLHVRGCWLVDLLLGKE